jgi:2'-5' RNA ligase
MAVRTFVALELSEGLREGILDLIEAMRREGLRASWSRASTLHLTLKFLGDVDEDRLPEVVSAVERAAAKTVPFSFATRRLGAFPSSRRPRVLWVGVDGGDELFRLQGAIEDELSALGFPRERRRFHPHITLGRLREPGSGSLERLLERLGYPEGEVRVSEVTVMSSTLAPAGAIHEKVAGAPLGSGGAGAA